MSVLVAVTTCGAFRSRAQAQRQTWAKQKVEGVDVRWFVGESAGQTAPDEIPLPCGDLYLDLPDKTQEICRWALSKGYTHLFKTDDDIYIDLDRLLADTPAPGDHYVGRVRGPSGGNSRVPPYEHRDYPAPYASGMGYWLDELAMRVIAGAPMARDCAEDRWVGNVLLGAGIHPVQAGDRYVLPQAKNAAPSGSEGPRKGNKIVASGEYEGTAMMRAHYERENALSDTALKELGLGNLPRICVLIKTMYRDGFLHRTLRGVERHLPGAKMVVVDDGKEHRLKVARYQELRDKGHECLWLPTDSGFGAKANAGVVVCDREYVLIFSDDFDAAKPGVVEGIQRMVTVLDAHPQIGVASGRVDGNPYEGFVERKVMPDGRMALIETRLPEYPHPCYEHTDGVAFARCDLTVNYSLIRRTVFDYVRWDTDYKIGGDHYTFMRDVRDAGFQIAYVHGAGVSQIPPFPGCQDASYPRYRARARRALPLFFHKQGIDLYVGFGGRIDEVAPSDAPIDWSI